MRPESGYSWVRYGLAVAAFIAIYVAAVALSIPGAVILTITGGVLFGISWFLLLAQLGNDALLALPFALALGTGASFAVMRWPAGIVMQEMGACDADSTGRAAAAAGDGRQRPPGLVYQSAGTAGLPDPPAAQ